MIGTATQDFNKLKQLCISNPRQVLQMNGTIPIHIVAVPGEAYNTVLLANEQHQVQVYLDYSEKGLIDNKPKH